MPEGNSRFQVVISAKDQFSPVFANLNRAVARLPTAVGKSAGATLEHVGMLRRGFEGLDRASRDLGRTLGDVVKPLRGLPLLGAGIGITGLAAATSELTDRWARFGQQTLFTSQNLGIAVESLQAFQGGARLAGVSAQAMTSGLSALQRHLYGARWGRDPMAIATFRQFGIAVTDAQGNVRSLTDVLPELASVVAAQKNPYVQAEIATRLFGEAGKELLPYLRQGAAGIAKLSAEARQHGILTHDQTLQLSSFINTAAALSESVEGIGKVIAADLAPALTPLLANMSKWIDSNRALVGQGVAQWVGKVGDALRATDWKAIGQDFKTIAGAVGEVSGAIQTLVGWYAQLGKAVAQTHDIATYKLPEPAARKRGQFEHIEREKGQGLADSIAEWATGHQKQSFAGQFWNWLMRGAGITTARPATAPNIAQPAPSAPAAPASLFSRGGIVPAAARGWEVPAAFGTDTVPAMLTPGEMVLPRDISLGFRALIRGGERADRRPAATITQRVAAAVPAALDRADYEGAGKKIATATGDALGRELPDLFARSWRSATEILRDTGMPLAPGGQAAVVGMLASWLNAAGRSASGTRPGEITTPPPGARSFAAPIVPLSGAGAFIKGEEGLRLSPYADAGHRAIGYGHDLTPTELRQGFIRTDIGHVPIGSAISREQAQAIFRRDYATRFQAVAAAIPGFTRLNENQREAILSYYYNTGRLPPGLAADIASGNLGAAADAIRHGIATSQGRFSAQLLARREREAALFERPVPAPAISTLAQLPAAAPAIASPYAQGGALAAAAADTRHHVQIDVNAPPGTRASLSGDGGPSESSLGLRIRYAMGSV